MADDATALALMSDADLAPGLAAALAARPLPAEGLWVFGYGSLIWQPEFAYSERRVGTVQGYHRRFCLLQRRFRGSADNPGLVLALDAGGTCEGVAFRLTGAEAAETLLPVWRREMRGNGYLGRWVPVETAAGTIQALTFVVNPDSDRYTGQSRTRPSPTGSRPGRPSRPQRRVPVPHRGRLPRRGHPLPAPHDAAGAGGGTAGGAAARGGSGGA